MDIGILLGESVIGLNVSSDRKFLHFDGMMNDFYFEACGECCSESWFAEIVDGDNLLSGDKISSISILNTKKAAGTKQEADLIYRIRLVTSKGECDIIFRNSSNGYYGGEVSQINKTDLPKDIEWEPIYTDDWRA